MSSTNDERRLLRGTSYRPSRYGRANAVDLLGPMDRTRFPSGRAQLGYYATSTLFLIAPAIALWNLVPEMWRGNHPALIAAVIAAYTVYAVAASMVMGVAFGVVPIEESAGALPMAPRVRAVKRKAYWSLMAAGVVLFTIAAMFPAAPWLWLAPVAAVVAAHEFDPRGKPSFFSSLLPKRAAGRPQES